MAAGGEADDADAGRVDPPFIRAGPCGADRPRRVAAESAVGSAVAASNTQKSNCASCVAVTKRSSVTNGA